MQPDVEYRPIRVDALRDSDPMTPVAGEEGVHPQECFHRDRYKVTHRAVFAGTGSGKTLAGTFEAVAWCLHHPGMVGAAFEPDYPMVKRNLLPALRRLLGGGIVEHRLVAEYHRTDHRIRFVNDAQLWFGSLDDPSKVEGQNLDFWYVDEPRLIRDWDDTEDGASPTLIRRLRGTNPDHPLGSWVTSSAPTRQLWVQYAEGGLEDARVYSWTTGDNPYLREDVVRRIRRGHHGAAHTRFYEGRYARSDDLVFADLDEAEHVRSCPEEWDRVTYGVDWGWTNPAALIVALWTGDTVHLVEGRYGSHLKPGELVNDAQELEDRYGRGTWYCGHDRPEHIDEFKRAGLRAESRKVAAEDGLPLLLDKLVGGELTIDAEARNLLDEARHLEWDPEADGDRLAPGPSHAWDAAVYAVAGHGGRTGAAAWSPIPMRGRLASRRGSWT